MTENLHGIEQWRKEARQTGVGGRINRTTVSEDLIRTLSESDQRRIRNGSTIVIDGGGNTSYIPLQNTNSEEKKTLLEEFRVNGRPTVLYMRGSTEPIEPNSENQYSYLHGLVSLGSIDAALNQNPNGLQISRQSGISPEILNLLPEKDKRDVGKGYTSLDILPEQQITSELRTTIVVNSLPAMAK